MLPYSLWMLLAFVVASIVGVRQMHKIGSIGQVLSLIQALTSYWLIAGLVWLVF